MLRDVDALRRELAEARPTAGATRFGPLSRLVWRTTYRLIRHHEERRDRLMLELLEHIEQLEGAVDRARWAQQVGPVLNEGTGSLVLARYGPVVQGRVEDAHGGFDGALDDVACDAGRLLFPAFDRFIRPTLRRDGTWEAEEAAFIRARLRPGGRAINVGANVGYTTLVLADAVGPSGTVIALEPDPLNFSLLWHNLRRNGVGHVVPIHAAAGDRTGSISLEHSPDNAGDHRTVHQPLAVGATQVPLVRIDDLVGPDACFELVSVDAQGFDHQIVRGMRELIDRCHPALLLEFWPPGILEAGDDPTKVLDEYRALGYHRLEVLTTGDDVTHATPDSIVDLAMSGRDHVTLALW